MKKEPFWKREMKEILAISSVFFVIFVLFLFMKKSLLDDYDVNFYIISTALVGSLILAKVVLLFDLLPLTKKTEKLLNIYRVFLRSLIYIFGYAVFTFLEHLIKGLIDGESYSQALKSTIHYLFSPASVTTFIGVFIAFLFFNTFWIIRASIGTTALYNMFFKKVTDDHHE
jgi:hypothetical protein